MFSIGLVNKSSWNPVLNQVLSLKHTFEIFVGAEKLWDYNPSEQNCIQYWTQSLESVSEDTKKYFETLFSPLFINEEKDLVLFRYNTLSGREDISIDEFWTIEDGFYSESRSVVIDIKNDCLVLTPFKKFRNLNEGAENELTKIKMRIKNASNVEISNKLDGSMQSARYYNGEYVMSGSQSLNKEKSFRLEEGYEFLTDNYKKMLKENPDFTFVFEYISEKDPHVVQYSKED